MEIKMEYPTWDEISKEVLGQVNPINPVNVYGNTAFVMPSNEVCACHNPKYQQDLVGVDIPVLLSQNNKESKGIIIILGESPLRTNANIVPNKNIVFGLPYAVHMGMGNPPQSRMYKKIFISLLMGINHIIKSEDWMELDNQTEGYSIYLTDIIKDWFAGREMHPSDDDIKLFEKELAILQQSHPNTKISIVVFGKKAEGAINILKRNATNFPKVIELPHPSKKNWTTWKLRIFEKAVYGNDIDYATDIYPDPSSPTNEDIVSEEALKEILARL